METVKRILYVISGLFALFALLIIFHVLSREFFVLNFGLVNMEEIYRMLLLTAVGLLLLVMLVQSLAQATQYRELQRTQRKVNDLKADLYDRRQQAMQKQRTIHPDEPHAGFPAGNAATARPEQTPADSSAKPRT